LHDPNSRIEVLNLSRGKVDDVFGDVGRAITDSFKVMRCEEEARTSGDIGFIGLHQSDALVERLPIEGIDLVIADRDLAGAGRVNVNERHQDAV
jgi:hypothetical protein